MTKAVDQNFGEGNKGTKKLKLLALFWEGIARKSYI